MKELIFSCLLFFFPVVIFGQQESTSKMDFGLGYSYDYNSKISHHSVHLFLSKNQNLYFAGPEFNSILKPFGDEVDLFTRRTNGLSFGYQRQFKPLSDILSAYVQMKFSYYRYSFTEYSLGTGPNERTNSILENTISAGIRISPNPVFTFLFGAGFGSTQGFFLMIEQAIPTLQAGLQVNLR